MRLVVADDSAVADKNDEIFKLLEFTLKAFGAEREQRCDRIFDYRGYLVFKTDDAYTIIANIVPVSTNCKVPLGYTERFLPSTCKIKITITSDKDLTYEGSECRRGLSNLRPPPPPPPRPYPPGLYQQQPSSSAYYETRQLGAARPVAFLMPLPATI